MKGEDTQTPVCCVVVVRPRHPCAHINKLHLLHRTHVRRPPPPARASTQPGPLRCKVKVKVSFMAGGSARQCDRLLRVFMSVCVDGWRRRRRRRRREVGFRQGEHMVKVSVWVNSRIYIYIYIKKGEGWKIQHNTPEAQQTHVLPGVHCRPDCRAV